MSVFPPFGHARPRICVIGGGMLGLSTGWFLQECDADVTLLERGQVGAGASWGNAGWLTPALVKPLPEAAVLRYALKAVFDPRSPVVLPLRPDLDLLRFVMGFSRRCTERQRLRALDALVTLSHMALDSFAAISGSDPAVTTEAADPFVACYQSETARQQSVRELSHAKQAGLEVEYQLVSAEAVRADYPILSPAVRFCLEIYGQRFINPPAYVTALAKSVEGRGGNVVSDARVTNIVAEANGAVVVSADGGAERYDAVVVAAGVQSAGLLRKFGVKQVQQSGRGYSFSVVPAALPAGPLRFPSERVACTPLGDKLRVSGIMEFAKADASPRASCFRTIAQAMSGLLEGVDFSARFDEWVGSRPCTTDGLPLIGSTRSPRVFAATGHGMWGMVLGPVSGRLLAQWITTGVAPPELDAFDPLR